MYTMYYVTRQTTKSGISTEINKVTGRDEHEAILKAKIKAYKAMESFMNEPSMISAFVGATNLDDGTYVVSETWESEVAPTTQTVTE